MTDALRCVTAPSQAAADEVDELKTYLRNNLDRMHYPAYRDRGLRSDAPGRYPFHIPFGAALPPGAPSLDR